MKTIAIYDIIIKEKGQPKGKKMLTHQHYFANTESRKNLNVVGSSRKPQNNYTKNDFLSVSQVAKKFNISEQDAEKLMKKLLWHNTKFVLNNRMASIIVEFDTIHLHPMAIEAFKQQLDKQKG